MNRILLFTLACVSCLSTIFAQNNPQKTKLPTAKTAQNLGLIDIQSVNSPEELVRDWIIGGDCFDVTNVTMKGAIVQIGSFTDGQSSIGMDQGALLTTGFWGNAVGPNDNQNASFDTGDKTQDVDLLGLNQAGGLIGGGQNPQSTFNRCVIEFDFTPTVTPITFQYVFASEEYCERVGPEFDDRFGFFIKGPGITGPYGGFANLAQIPPGPGSGTGFGPTYVGVNNLNQTVNAGIFKNNLPPALNNCGGSGNPGLTPLAIQYDGYSSPLTMAINVIPCQTYRIKIKIADLGDGNGDSGVFIKAAGFTSGNKATCEPRVDNDPDNLIAVESCDNGAFVFERLGNNLSAPVIVNYTISGTATAGVDYAPFPSVTTIPANQTSVTIPVNVINDALIEGDETVRLTFTNPCSCFVPFKEITIRDYTPMSINPLASENCGPGLIFLESSINDGDAPYTYKWSNGATTETIEPFVAATQNYKVTVTDECGKTIVQTIPVKIRKLPTASTAGLAYLCRTASAKVSIPIALTGEGPWTVFYENNGVPESVDNVTANPFLLEVFEAGIYKITGVLDGGFCDGTGSGTYTVLSDEVEFSGIATQISCFSANNGTINTTATLGIPPYIYNWSPFLGSVADPSGLAPGFYKVTVTDAKGCTNRDSFLINQPAAIALLSQNLVGANCENTAGGSVSVAATGGAGGFTYLWNNGQTSASIFGLSSGNYIVTATDQTGCTKTLSVNIPGNFVAPTAQATANGTVTCGNQNVALSGNGSSNGQNFSYLWSGGSFSGPVNQITATAIAPGNYILTVKNTTNGCTATATATVTGSVVLPTAVTNVLGETNCINSTVSLSGNGSSTGNFSYQWTGPSIVGNPNSLNITANQAGFYQLLITNNLTGCVNSSTAQVIANFAPPVVAIKVPQILNCNRLTVTLDEDVTPLGGIFSYNWSTANGQIVSGGNSPMPVVGAAGTYNLLVTNVNNGCTATAATEVLKTLAPLVSVNLGQNIACFGQNNASATANPSLGAGNFSLLWSNGQTSATAQNLAAGQINIVATDADGCTATASATISQPTILTTSAISTGQSIVLLNDGTANVNAAGGTPNYQYLWSNGATTANITNLAPGDYTATATDANGCTSVSTTNVAIAPCQLVMTANVQNALCNGSADGSLLVSLTNEASPVVYVWSNGANSAQAIELAAGGYTVTATDANGCTLVTTYAIGQPDPINITATVENVGCIGDETGQISLAVSGGTPTYAYIWENGTTNATNINLAQGLYSASVTDANGCLQVVFANVLSADSQLPVLNLSPKTVPIDDNGKATLVATSFNNGSTDNCGITNWAISPIMFDCTELGVHDVTISVSDDAGNLTSKVTQVTIIDNKPPVLSCPASKFTYSCTPIVTYAFPVALDNCLGNGGQFSFVSGLPSGTQFPIGVTTNTWAYTDAGGNIGTCAFDVTVYDLPTLTADQVKPLCFGDCNGALTAIPVGGNGPFKYAWANGQAGATASNLCSGSFQLTVTDGGNCQSIQTLALTQPGQLTLAVGSVTNDIGMAGVGAISVLISGGTPVLSFKWTKNGQIVSNNQNLTGLNTGNYILEIIDANGCKLLSQPIFVDNLLSANEPEWGSQWQLLPNPTTGFASFIFSENTISNGQLQIFDATGRLVTTQLFDKNQSSLEFDLSDQPAGLYQILVKMNENGAISRRLVVIR